MLVALAALLAVGPVAALAAPDDNEYSLDLPEGGGGGTDPTAEASTAGEIQQPSNGTSGSDSGGEPVQATTPTDSDDSGDSSGAGTGGGGGSGSGSGSGSGDGGKGGGEPQGAGGTESEQRGVSALSIEPGAANSAAEDSGGGISIVLVLIALGALACVALAVWQMRRGSSRGNVGGPAEISRGA